MRRANQTSTHMRKRATTIRHPKGLLVNYLHPAALMEGPRASIPPSTSMAETHMAPTHTAEMSITPACMTLARTAGMNTSMVVICMTLGSELQDPHVGIAKEGSSTRTVCNPASSRVGRPVLVSSSSTCTVSSSSSSSSSRPLAKCMRRPCSTWGIW